MRFQGDEKGPDYTQGGGRAGRRSGIWRADGCDIYATKNQQKSCRLNLKSGLECYFLSFSATSKICVKK
jgi:hypothetical protein